MKIVYGSVLDVTRGVIGHQVNCRHKAGAGLALRIKERFPSATAAYMSKPVWKLGDALFCEISQELYIAHLAGQYNYGRGQKYTDYAALESALVKAAAFAHDKALPLCLPYSIGCGLAGGRWSIVSVIIERACPEAVLYRI